MTLYILSTKWFKPHHYHQGIQIEIDYNFETTLGFNCSCDTIIVRSWNAIFSQSKMIGADYDRWLIAMNIRLKTELNKVYTFWSVCRESSEFSVPNRIKSDRTGTNTDCLYRFPVVFIIKYNYIAHLQLQNANCSHKVLLHFRSGK